MCVLEFSFDLEIKNWAYAHALPCHGRTHTRRTAVLQATRHAQIINFTNRLRKGLVVKGAGSDADTEHLIFLLERSLLLWALRAVV